MFMHIHIFIFIQHLRFLHLKIQPEKDAVCSVKSVIIASATFDTCTRIGFQGCLCCVFSLTHYKPLFTSEDCSFLIYGKFVNVKIGVDQRLYHTSMQIGYVADLCLPENGVGRPGKGKGIRPSTRQYPACRGTVRFRTQYIKAFLSL